MSESFVPIEFPSPPSLTLARHSAESGNSSARKRWAGGRGRISLTPTSIRRVSKRDKRGRKRIFRMEEIFFSNSVESEEERAAMLKALRQSQSLFSRYYLNDEFNDVTFDFELRDDIVIGQPFR